MLRAKVVILCDSNWFDYLKFFILFKAKKVQVWHGLGFKNLDLSNPQDPFFQLSKTRQWLRRLCGRFPTYDLFVTTSIFYSEKLFKKSFHVKKILPLGFPRNDIFFQSSFDQNLINVDCDVLKKVKILKKIGKTIILYAPTFRSSANLCKQLNIEIAKLGSMVKTLTKQKNIVLVIKSHPCSENYIFDTNSEDLFFYDFNCDIYPLLKITDLLITDYSSICQDYLLLDRPMIFFCPDLQSYIHDDKNLAFDYLNMTPGPKIHNTEELLKTIMDRDQKEDGYKEMRKTIRGLIHDHQDGEASKRIYDYLFENYLE